MDIRKVHGKNEKHSKSNTDSKNPSQLKILIFTGNDQNSSSQMVETSQ